MLPKITSLVSDTCQSLQDGTALSLCSCAPPCRFGWSRPLGAPVRALWDRRAGQASVGSTAGRFAVVMRTRREDRPNHEAQDSVPR